MFSLAQAAGEYGGAEGGLLGVIVQLVTNVSETVRGSIADHPVIWGVGACVALWLLFRRR